MSNLEWLQEAPFHIWNAVIQAFGILGGIELPWELVIPMVMTGIVTAIAFIVKLFNQE